MAGQRQDQVLMPPRETAFRAGRPTKENPLICRYAASRKTSGPDTHSFDAATGKEKEEDRSFRDGIGPVQDMLPHKDLVIAVHSGGNVQPFSTYERW
ncbi:hypothetical protein ACFW2T_06000 [Streptomyces sp. NPDC058892]|uniref:hypothetical protein n=1 Tax=unclassified Streptomyces TaxID=2593676 RepID=UPI0036BB1F6B